MHTHDILPLHYRGMSPASGRKMGQSYATGWYQKSKSAEADTYIYIEQDGDVH